MMIMSIYLMTLPGLNVLRKEFAANSIHLVPVVENSKAELVKMMMMILLRFMFMRMLKLEDLLSELPTQCLKLV